MAAHSLVSNHFLTTDYIRSTERTDCLRLRLLLRRSLKMSLLKIRRTQRTQRAWISRATGFFAGRPSSLLHRMRHRKASACDRSMRAAGSIGYLAHPDLQPLDYAYIAHSAPRGAWGPPTSPRRTSSLVVARQRARRSFALPPLRQACLGPKPRHNPPRSPWFSLICASRSVLSGIGP